MVLPLVVGGVLAAGALAKGVGGIMASNKAAKGAMDAGGALVLGAEVANNARLGNYDAASTLDSRNLQQILQTNRNMFRSSDALQVGARDEALASNNRARNASDAIQQQYYNPLIAQGDQYRNAMAYNDGFGDRPEGYAEFTGTPGYQFRRQEADDALNNRLAAMGSLNSGAAVRRAMEVADGMASQEHQLHYNRLAAGANQGAQARGALANNRTSILGQYTAANNAARMATANNRTQLRSNYGAADNAGRNNSLANQMNLLNMRGESMAKRATDVANAYASARMGATKAQGQAIQQAGALPGQVAGAFMSGASMGMGGGGMMGSMAGMNGPMMGGGMNFSSFSPQSFAGGSSGGFPYRWAGV